MSWLHNPYAKAPPTNFSTADDENISVQSPAPAWKVQLLKKWRTTIMRRIRQTMSHKCNDIWRRKQEEIKFKPLPDSPSFNWSIDKETLHDNNWPYIFWVSLCLPILMDPVNPMAAASLWCFGRICGACGRRRLFSHTISANTSLSMSSPTHWDNKGSPEWYQWLAHIFPQVKLQFLVATHILHF